MFFNLPVHLSIMLRCGTSCLCCRADDSTANKKSNRKLRGPRRLLQRCLEQETSSYIRRSFSLLITHTHTHTVQTEAEKQARIYINADTKVKLYLNWETETVCNQVIVITEKQVTEMLSMDWKHPIPQVQAESD